MINEQLLLSYDVTGSFCVLLFCSTYSIFLERNVESDLTQEVRAGDIRDIREGGESWDLCSINSLAKKNYSSCLKRPCPPVGETPVAFQLSRLGVMSFKITLTGVR